MKFSTQTNKANKFLTETLMKQLNFVVMEKIECDYRNETLLVANLDTSDYQLPEAKTKIIPSNILLQFRKCHFGT